MATIDLAKISYFVVAVLKDGTKLHLENVAENISWEENEKELAVRLNLIIRDVPYGGGRLSEVLALCTVVYIYADWGSGQKEIFRGTIWEWDHSQIANDNIVITAYDMLYALQKSTDNRYYAKGKSTNAVVSDLLSAWGVPLGKFTVPNATHQKLLYKSKTISAMLTETLDDAKKLGSGKYVIRAKEGKVDVVKQGENEEIYAFSSDTNLTKTGDRFSMTNLVTRVIVTGKDDEEGRPKVEATINGKTEYGILQAIQAKGSSTLAEAKTEAQEILNERGSPERTTTLQSPDLPFVRKGDMIHATADRLKGYFIIKGVSHNATTRTMQMEVEPA